MTPLTAMRGYIETLAMPELQLDAPTRERYLGIVTEETHRLERSSATCSTWRGSKAAARRMRRDASQVAALFERVAARHERELRERGITLEFAGRPPARSTSTAIPIGSSRRCRTWRPTRCATRRTAAASRCASSRARGRPSACASATAARHSGGSPAAHLRPVLQGGRGAEGGRRQRPRPLDRQGDRRAPRRHDHARATSRAPCSRSCFHDVVLAA